MPLLEDIIKTALVVPAAGDPNVPADGLIWGTPLMLIGEPGVGKTTRINDVSESLGLRYCEVTGSTHPPEDFSGVAVPDGSGGLNMVSPLPQVKALAGKRGVLVLDEITSTLPATQAAMMNAVLYRRFGETSLGGDCRLLAAGNDPKDAANGQEMNPALANRFTWLDVATPSVKEWGDWFQFGGAKRKPEPINALEDRVRASWAKTWPVAQGQMLGFLEKMPDLLHVLPKDGDPNRGKAWPSPRSWDQAARCLATCLATSAGAEVTEKLVSGCIGIPASTQFFTWVEQADLPSVEEVLSGKWEVDGMRLDRTVAAITMASGYICGLIESDKTRIDNAIRFWSVLERVIGKGMTDLTWGVVSNLVNKQLSMSATEVPDRLHAASKKVIAKVNAHATM